MDEEIILCPHCYQPWDGVHCWYCGFDITRKDPYYD